MEIMKIGTLDCVVNYPKNFSKDKKNPLIISLHGAGNREHGVESLKNDGYFVHTSNCGEFPFVSIMPYCSENTWFDLFEQLKATVNEIIKMVHGVSVENGLIYKYDKDFKNIVKEYKAEKKKNKKQ